MDSKQKAVDDWEQGLSLWNDDPESQEGRDRVIDLFRRAQQADPTFVAPMLGLHYLLPEERAEWLERMIPHVDNLQEGDIHSSYQPLIWHYLPITSSFDIRRAWAKELISQGRFEEADLQLQLCPDDELTSISRIDLLFHSEQYQHCLRCLQSINSAGEELDSELKVIRALVLKKMNLPLPALHLLREVEKKEHGKRRLFVLYEQALLLLEMKQGEAARGVLEMIYAEDISYRDVARLLGREGVDPVWEDIVARLRNTDSKSSL